MSQLRKLLQVCEMPQTSESVKVFPWTKEKLSNHPWVKLKVDDRGFEKTMDQPGMHVVIGKVVGFRPYHSPYFSDTQDLSVETFVCRISCRTRDGEPWNRAIEVHSSYLQPAQAPKE